MDHDQFRQALDGKRVLVTGGPGFVGSNLALRLLELGADVHVVDALLPGCGGNPFNLAPAGDRIHVSVRDLRERDFIREAVQDVDLIFNLAGEISHIGSMEDPETDLELNCRAHISLLQACRHANPSVHAVQMVEGTEGVARIDDPVRLVCPLLF